MQLSRSLHNDETYAKSDIECVMTCTETDSKGLFTPKGNRNEKE